MRGGDSQGVWDGLVYLVGQHHQLNGHELGQAPGDSEGQEGLVCCSPGGRKESDTT